MDRDVLAEVVRTRSYTRGTPRHLVVAGDGSRVAFIRSRHGTDTQGLLWVLDVGTGRERLITDPHQLVEGTSSPEEQARRERARETELGVVSFATDRDARVATFALGGRLFVADLASGDVRYRPAVEPVVDPRPDPSGHRVAYVSGGELLVGDLSGSDRRRLTPDEGPEVTWGLAEFVASEEMNRFRGFWWSPDGSRLAATRVDVSPVERLHISNPADPESAPTAVPYPRAGTANADVGLWVFDPDDPGSRPTEVAWDRRELPYLVDVSWEETGPLTLLVQSRDQRRTQVLTAAPSAWEPVVVREDHDPHWREMVVGVPRWLPDGRLVWTDDRDDTRRLMIADRPATPAGLQVRQVVHVGDGRVLVRASDDPLDVHVWQVPADGGEPVPLTRGPGVHDASAGGDVVVVQSWRLEQAPTFVVRRGEAVVGEITSVAARPPRPPNVTFHLAGRRDLRAALLLPPDRDPDQPLPVLMDPYGGPHSQRVLRSAGRFHQSQWFADQGLAVVVVDGRGTPGRGPAWEKAVRGDLGQAPLEDQVDGLHALAARHPELDVSRVAIRGWSFGGYLAALAVLRRPDVFHAAVAGAPVTDWALYDTHYTERYLGDPARAPEAYRRSSLLPLAAELRRPLLLVHGFNDDNVVVAHTLTLSAALVEAARPHSVLPVPGGSHMLREDVLTQSLLLLELEFLRRALGLPGD